VKDKEIYLECTNPMCRRKYPLHELNEKEEMVMKMKCDECGSGLRRRVVR